MERRHWGMALAALGYYGFVRWMHSLLDAGPLVLIVTSLTLIFTIGLGDEANRDGLSAYAVFNRGCERLLGSVDADALLSQYVGGGFAAAGGMGMGGPMPAPVNEDQEDHQAPRQGGRLGMEEANAEAEDHNDPPNRNHRARKSGKKRRRNMEQRQEVRRQRDAVAEALGLEGPNGQEEAMALQRILEEQIAADHR